MSAETPTVELFVRSLLPHGAAQRQEAVIDRLERLADQGQIEDFDVTVWGTRVAPDSSVARTDPGRHVLQQVATIESGATREGVDVEPFFERTTAEREVLEESYETIRLPVMAMVEYVDDEVRYVAPHAHGDAVQTVLDRLDDLEASGKSGVASPAETAV